MNEQIKKLTLKYHTHRLNGRMDSQFSSDLILAGMADAEIAMGANPLVVIPKYFTGNLGVYLTAFIRTKMEMIDAL